MEIIVAGKHLEISDAIREYATNKASRLPRYYDRVSEVEVIADKGENRHYKVDLIVHVEGRDAFIAQSHEDDLYAGIDEVIDKMERQLTDHKEKLRNHKRTG